MKKALLFAAASPLLLSATHSEGRSKPAGEGVVCAAVLTYVAERQGRACYPGQDTEFQASLAQMSADFDAYIIRNVDGGEEALAHLKAEQVDEVSDEALCKMEDADFYAAFRDNPKRGEWEANIDDLLSRDGPPTWGTCL